MTTQLKAANLSQFSPNIQVPQYDRRKVRQSMMHVGVGGFHRAHQAVYTDDLLNEGRDSAWGFCGVGLLKHDAGVSDSFERRRRQGCEPKRASFPEPRITSTHTHIRSLGGSILLRSDPAPRQLPRS